jgi:hypothetical protein
VKSPDQNLWGARPTVRETRITVDFVLRCLEALNFPMAAVRCR